MRQHVGVCRPTLRVSPACDFVYWLIIPSTCTSDIQLRRDMIQLTRCCSCTALLHKRRNYVQHDTTKSLLTPLAHTTTHWINDGRAYTHSQPQWITAPAHLSRHLIMRHSADLLHILITPPRNENNVSLFIVYYAMRQHTEIPEIIQ